jgi:hypothetical protein
MGDNNPVWPGWPAPGEHEPPSSEPPELIQGMFSATTGPVARCIAEWRAREGDN